MKKVVAYVGRNAVVTREQAEILTHINVAFGLINAEGMLFSNQHPFMNQVSQIREWNPNIRILLSIVPETPEAFTKVSASKELRANVTASCKRLVEEEGFDGVDFDWEYPCVPSNGMDSSPEDKHNFTLLCRAAREGLDAAGGGLLTIAAGADLYYIESVEAKELAEVLDYVNIMTYDLKCGFHALTGHHTALYSSTGDIFRNSCDQAARLFEDAGFPAEKILIGAAFYSRQWDDVKDRNHGFLQYTQKGGGYGPAYDGLTEEFINKNGFVRYWDEEAKAPYLFNGSTFLSYDDEESLYHKCAYIKQEKLGGIFYWCHDTDKSGVLLRAIGKGMKED